jgi:uncharacterized protein
VTRYRPSAGRPAARKPLRISQAALDAANRVIVRQQPANPFAPPPSLHPTPMAMDQAWDGGLGYSRWAFGALGSAVEEGQMFLGYPVLAAMSQRAEYNRMVTTIADDMTRKWIEFKASAAATQRGIDKSDKIKAMNDKFEALDAITAWKNEIIGALTFGRGHLYIDIGDTDNRDELKTDIGNGGRSAPMVSSTTMRSRRSLRFGAISS